MDGGGQGKFTVAERIAQIPADRLQDQGSLEVPAPEVVLGPVLQTLGNRAQDHGPSPREEQSWPYPWRAVNASNLRRAQFNYTIRDGSGRTSLGNSQFW